MGDLRDKVKCWDTFKLWIHLDFLKQLLSFNYKILYGSNSSFEFNFRYLLFLFKIIEIAKINDVIRNRIQED